MYRMILCLLWCTPVVELVRTPETNVTHVYMYISGSNPTTLSYNASVVNFYNATGSLARFGNKNILFYFEKRCRLLQRWRCSCKLKNRRIGSRSQSYDLELQRQRCKNFQRS
jgi:hypothetical protein